MIKDMEMECKTKFSTDVEFSFSFKAEHSWLSEKVNSTCKSKFHTED